MAARTCSKRSSQEIFDEAGPTKKAKTVTRFLLRNLGEKTLVENILEKLNLPELLKSTQTCKDVNKVAIKILEKGRTKCDEELYLSTLGDNQYLLKAKKVSQGALSKRSELTCFSYSYHQLDDDLADNNSWHDRPGQTKTTEEIVKILSYIHFDNVIIKEHDLLWTRQVSEHVFKQILPIIPHIRSRRLNYPVGEHFNDILALNLKVEKVVSDGTSNLQDDRFTQFIKFINMYDLIPVSGFTR